MAAKRRKCWAWVLCVAMMLSMMPVTSWADEGDVAYYLDAQGVVQTIPDEAVFLTDTITTWSGLDGGSWYVADGTVSLPQRVEVQGDVHLVLCDGAVLTIDQGIHVTGNNSLTIYGQEKGTGLLKIEKVASDNAAIGGNDGEAGGVIEINGGTIDATGGSNAAGIGGGYGAKGTSGRIIINDGIIHANGGQGAGIGGGAMAQDRETASDNIEINGGKIYAESANYGAGIGGGYYGGGGVIVINGGDIQAIGKNGGAGIGSGAGSVEMTSIVINGGTVYASGSDLMKKGAAGIGGGHLGAGGVIEIYGGTIHALSGKGENPGDAIGNGGGYEGGQNNIVVSPTQSCPIIYAKSGSEQVPTFSGSTADWQGIVFSNDKGQVYGNVTLTSDLTIAPGQSLVIPANTTLTVPQGVTLTNNGTITGSGTLKGTVAGNDPAPTIDDGRAELTVVVEPEQSGTVEGAGRYEKGSMVMLNATPAEGYHFVGWKTGDNTFENVDATYSFTIEDDCHLTAIFALHKPGDWQQDAKEHWKNCVDCGSLIEQAEHVWQNGACTICGYACLHSGGQATCEHRAQCAVCGEDYGALGEHAYLYHERVAPTYTAEGMAAHYECSVCGQLFNEEKVETTREALILPHLDWPVVVPPDPEPPEEPDEELPPSEVVLPFNDVVEGAWYHDAVADVYARGWMTGTSDTNFAPEQAMTRAMVAATLHRMEGSPLTKASGFTDVASGTWYENAVAWAQQAGVVHGFDDGTFQPNAVITREQLAAMLQNYSMYKGEHTDARQDLNAYSDADAVSAWAQDALSWACAEGVLQGMTETSLSPQSSATRAQMAAVLLRLA